MRRKGFITSLILNHGKDGPYSADGIGTGYGQGGLGIGSLWGKYFPHSSRQGLGPLQPPVQVVPGLFSRGKASRAWRLPHTPI